MIRINLAKNLKASSAGTGTVDLAAGDLDAQEIQKQGLYRLLVIALFPLGLIVVEKQTLPAKAAELRQMQQRLTALQSKNASARSAVDETKKFKDSEAKLHAQIGIIEGLRKDRLHEVRILDLVQREIPEKLWLTRIDLKDRRLEFQGTASTDVELTSFMELLARSPLVEEVNLVKSSEVNTGTQIEKRFEVRCMLGKTASAAGKPQ